MTNLPLAYEEVLKNLKNKSGSRIAIIIRALLLSEHKIVEFNARLKQLPINEETYEELSAVLVDQVATDIAYMCTLANYNFKNEVQPIAEEVRVNIKKSHRLQ